MDPNASADETPAEFWSNLEELTGYKQKPLKTQMRADRSKEHSSLRSGLAEEGHGGDSKVRRLVAV